jgi:poly-gamma-glutamate synthesis protein (capsule biosynthesis protein)
VTTIGLLGDVMLGRGVAKELGSTPPEELWAPEVREVAAACDLVVCNLECCLSERGRPTERIPGKPFFFRAPPAATDSLHAIRSRAVSLANNHALDYEEDALADTLEHLERASIAATGAGLGSEQARRAVSIEANGARLGIVAATDHPAEYAAGAGEWGVAYGDLRAGAPEWLLAELAKLRGECDVVLVFLHWGPNMTVRPAGWQRSLAAELLAGGADAVAGHSAHVFHGIGWDDSGLALYDLGDALDDYAIDPTLRNDLGVMALWRPGPETTLELVGLRLEYCFTRLANGADADWIAIRLERACGELGTTVERLGEQRFRVLRG